MAGDPTNVGHAGEFIVGVYIEDVFDGQGGAEEVSAGGVDDALGLSGRTGCLEKGLLLLGHETFVWGGGDQSLVVF